MNFIEKTKKFTNKIRRNNNNNKINNRTLNIMHLVFNTAVFVTIIKKH